MIFLVELLLFELQDRFVIYGFLIQQILNHLQLFSCNLKVQSNEIKENGVAFFMLLLMVVCHRSLLHLIKKRHWAKFNALQVLISMIALEKRITGQFVLVAYLSLSFVALFCIANLRISDDIVLHLNRKKQKLIYNFTYEQSRTDELKDEQQQNCESLEEGIVVIKKEQISFANTTFRDIIGKLNSKERDEEEKKDLLSHKIF